MPRLMISKTAIIGAGVIGRSWAQVFIRSGCSVALYDKDARQVTKAVEWIHEELEMERRDGAIDGKEMKSRLERLRQCSSLIEALADSQYVQECGPERMETKKAMFADLDKIVRSETIVGSSTSGLSMTEIAAGLRNAARYLVTHPVNPPHVIPVVELVPGEETDPAIVTIVSDFLSTLGQMPITLRFHIPGFLLNRLQAAMLREAIYLVESGVADLDDIDSVVSEGVGLRWALMGPFGVANSNADGGLRENLSRFREMILELMNDLGPPSTLSPTVIDKLSDAMERKVGADKLAQVRHWRDRMVRKLLKLKAEDPPP
jgi:L-gulonate 3-dehydrogenase